MNIIQVVHLEDVTKTRYTYEVPPYMRINKGILLQVHNKYGKAVVRSVTDSSDVDDNVLDMIMEGKKVTAKVTGVYKLLDFEEELNVTDK